MHAEDIARVAHEANRAFCEAHGDNSQVPWDQAPDWQKESAVEGVISVLVGRVNSPEESHQAWVRHKKENGWTYGPVKDPDRREHPDLVPFCVLPDKERAKDTLFINVVLALKPLWIREKDKV